MLFLFIIRLLLHFQIASLKNMAFRAHNVSLQHWDKSAADLTNLEVSATSTFTLCSE